MQGGLVVVPSAPVLVALTEDSATREALRNADFAITDSGLMVLMWGFLSGERIRRVSGLEYLKLLLERLAGEREHGRTTIWVMPTQAAVHSNVAWLHEQGHGTTARDCYVAPHYGGGALSDPALLAFVAERRPRHVIMAIGGGVQERLGYYLKKNLPECPAIHCTGAAIGFLSGDQVRIPDWADRYLLGWLFRCLSAPHRFVPRYWKAARLVWLMIRYRDQLPPLRS